MVCLLHLLTCSTHSTCAVLSTVSVWRGARGYLKMLAVAIAKFRSYDTILIVIDSYKLGCGLVGLGSLARSRTT